MVTNSIENTKPDSGQLILTALENKWKNYRKELKHCREEFSFDAVHDLRTATRRMLAMIQLLNSISPRPRLKKLIRAFKDQLDTFDDLRDAQVILAEISDVIQQFPQLQPFQNHMKRIEEKALRKVRKDIKTLETAEMKKRMRKTHDAIEEEVNGHLEEDILQAVDDSYMTTQQRYGWVDLARPATIHRVRIAFKSLRYMVEIVHPLLPNFPAENLKRMDEYQTRMGDIQDLEVFTHKLADFSESPSSTELELVRRYYDQHRNEAISTYADEMKQLHTFWRAAPGQPFPWEKTL